MQLTYLSYAKDVYYQSLIENDFFKLLLDSKSTNHKAFPSVISLWFTQPCTKKIVLTETLPEQ